MTVRSYKFQILHWIGILGAASLLAACAPKAKLSVPASADDTGIVHGKTVAAKEELGGSVVALVSQRNEGQALCTGSILAKDLILTAAHCVEGDPQQLVIVFAKDVRKASQNNLRPADAFLQNPRWKSQDSEGQGDLALIHFDGGLPDGYRPVHLAGTRLNLSKGQETLLVGYGVTSGSKHKGAGVLRETMSSLIDRFSPTELITDGRTSSVCFGDSGGPAFVRQGSRYTQWGVANSVTSQNCNEASIHTDLSSYKAWLKSAAQELRSNRRSQTESGPWSTSDEGDL